MVPRKGQYIKNWAQNPLKVDVGLENYVSFLKIER